MRMTTKWPAKRVRFIHLHNPRVAGNRVDFSTLEYFRDDRDFFSTPNRYANRFRHRCWPPTMMTKWFCNRCWTSGDVVQRWPALCWIPSPIYDSNLPSVSSAICRMLVTAWSRRRLTICADLSKSSGRERERDKFKQIARNSPALRWHWPRLYATVLISVFFYFIFAPSSSSSRVCKNSHHKNIAKWSNGTKYRDRRSEACTPQSTETTFFLLCAVVIRNIACVRRNKSSTFYTPERLDLVCSIGLRFSIWFQQTYLQMIPFDGSYLRYRYW